LFRGFDYKCGSLEFLRTYVIIFNDGSDVKSEIERLEDISSGKELEIYFKNGKYNFKYHVNFDPITTEEFLNKKESSDKIPETEDNIPF